MLAADTQGTGERRRTMDPIERPAAPLAVSELASRGASHARRRPDEGPTRRYRRYHRTILFLVGEQVDGHGLESAPSTTALGPNSDAHAADLALVRLALAGDRDARDRLFERLRCVPRFVCAFHRRFGAPLDAGAVEDLVQNVLFSVWRRLPDFRGEAALETFAYPFCRFETLNAVRRWQRRASHDVATGAEDGPPEPAVDMPVDRGLLEAETLHLLAVLSPSEARVVHLRHFEGREVSEIAALLAISTSSVKTHYYRALAKLRARLDPHGTGGPW
jgi:RNA polymerase sigma-70 factor (ECF subfamily)